MRAPEITVHLFHESDWPHDDRILTEAERAVVARYRFEEDRRRTAGGRILVRILLAERLGLGPEALRFTTNTYGKPAIADASLHFNLTHSGAWIGIAIGDTPVGIDIEQVKQQRDVQGLGGRYFLPHEREWIAAQDDPARGFFRMWSMKESVLKADGRGMSLPLADVLVDAHRRVASAPSERWELTELKFDEGYAGCVAAAPGAVVEICPSP